MKHCVWNLSGQMRRMSQYESVYGIGLLDDIHNYFPELLYNQEAFDSPVLTYVRRQTRERFDLFSHGERQWRASLPVSSAAAAATGAAAATATGAAAATASGFAAHRRAFSRTMATPGPSTPINSTLPTTTNSDILTTRLLLTLMSIPSGGPMGIGIGAGLGTGDNGFLQPVIVRPTAEEIEANTTVGHVVGDESVSCAICQDILTPEQEGRKLLGCGHWFHRGCIDVWLTSNVRCPNCRHDVRVAVTSRS